MTPTIYAQDTTKVTSKKRIYRTDNSMDAPITYSCTDSIRADFTTDIISLYGSAEVVYDGITLTADLIEMDTEKKEVYAIYRYDADSNRVGIPKFKEGSEEFTAASIRYNFDTEKGYIEELKTQQDEMYLHMGTAKRQQNEHIHFTEGKFTTCELDEPHFHFQLSKAVMVPEERIATGPMNLHVKSIPTPLGLPFSVIPTKERESSGLMFPMIAPTSQYGFGIQDIGYYFPIKQSEEIQTTVYGSIYSQGTFELRNQTDYKRRYKFSGNLNLSYRSFKRPFPNDTNRRRKIEVQWNHQQERKANPYWQFNARVNFQSDNNGQTDLDPLSDQYFQNNFNSDINLVRTFPTKPITIGLKTALKQNSSSEQVDIDLPTLSVNVNRFFPFKGLNNGVGKERFYEKIGLQYSLEGKNRGLVDNSLLENRQFDMIQNQFQNGIRQNARMNYPLQLFNQIVTLNTSADYTLRTNFQSIEKNYNPTSGAVENDTLRGAGFSQDLSFSSELSTNLYAYYSFLGNPDMKMRHVMTPRVSFRFQPDLSSFVTETLGPNDEEITYSPYEASLYSGGVGRQVGQINYSINNTFEIKHPNRKDTTEEFSKKRIIDAFSISGNYDIFKDTMKLSDVSLKLRVTPFTGLNFVSSGSFSPYAFNEENQDYNEYAWNADQGMGRFRQIDLSTTYTFASKKSKEKIDKNQEEIGNQWGSDFQYYTMNPHDLIDFDIPWKINLTHSWFFNLNTDITEEDNREYSQRQNLKMSGDVSFTERWKMGFNSSYDIEGAELTQTRISLNRDMHCWQLAFYWTPLGQQSFMVRFNATSALFQSAKLELRKPPEFL
ncbi:MAG: putative LPS assembly protein LptD [Bacteroidota bacterium]